MRRVVVLAVVLVVVATVGVLRHPWHGAHGASTRETDRPSSSPADGGRRIRRGGTGRDVEAARRAAVAAVARTGEVVRAGLFSRRELIESFTTARFGPTLAAATSAQVNALLLALGVPDVDAADAAVVEPPVTAAAEATPHRGAGAGVVGAGGRRAGRRAGP